MHNTRNSRKSLSFDPAESTSSAEGARRDVLRYGPLGSEDQANSAHQSLDDQACSDDFSQEDANTITDEADQAQLDQEQQDEAYARRLTEEETSRSTGVPPNRSANRETANREAGTGQYLRTNILLQPPEEDILSGSSTPTNVDVDERSNNMSLADHVVRANVFLEEGNVVRRILSATQIFSQQSVINLTGTDIVALRLSDDQKQLALKKMTEGPIVVAAKPAHSSNVNIINTKTSPFFNGVITAEEVNKLVTYSHNMGPDQYIDIRSLCNKAAIVTINNHLSARGDLCGYPLPTDWERWLDWDHRKFSDFMVILFGDETKVDKPADLHKSILGFNFGFTDSARLGNIIDTVSEQKVLNELSELIQNDYSPDHKTVGGMQEVVRLMHQNLKHDSPIMLAMNKLGPASKTPDEFFENSL